MMWVSCSLGKAKAMTKKGKGMQRSTEPWRQEHHSPTGHLLPDSFWLGYKIRGFLMTC